MKIRELMEEAPAQTGETSGADGGALDAGGQDVKTPADGGALDGVVKTQTDGEPQIDWDKITDEEYFRDFKVPEGMDVDVSKLSQRYGAFLRENRIPQGVMSKFLEIEAGVAKEQEAEAAKEEETARKAFAEEKAKTLKMFTPEQLASANSALAELKDDRAFFDFATGRMANNPTLVRLLVSWADSHAADGVDGAGKGAGTKPADFASLWRG